MPSRRSFLTAFPILLMGIALPGAAPAQSTILHVHGAQLPGGLPLALDLAALDALPQTRFRTSTPWTEGVHEFSGVLLGDALAAWRVAPRRLRLVALNDYVAEGEVASLARGSALLATRIDGAPMAIDDKGPVFVVFPFDRSAEFRRQIYYGRSVWQLTRIDLLP